jgi:hypothetical protein
MAQEVLATWLTDAVAGAVHSLHAVRQQHAGGGGHAQAGRDRRFVQGGLYTTRGQHPRNARAAIMWIVLKMQSVATLYSTTASMRHHACNTCNARNARNARTNGNVGSPSIALLLGVAGPGHPCSHQLLRLNDSLR